MWSAGKVSRQSLKPAYWFATAPRPASAITSNVIAPIINAMADPSISLPIMGRSIRLMQSATAATKKEPRSRIGGCLKQSDRQSNRLTGSYGRQLGQSVLAKRDRRPADSRPEVGRGNLLRERLKMRKVHEQRRLSPRRDYTHRRGLVWPKRSDLGGRLPRPQPRQPRVGGGWFEFLDFL